MLALLTLNALPKLGPIRIRRLLDHFGSADTILAQPSRELQQVPGIGPEIASIITKWSTHFDPEAELTRCQKSGIDILTPDSPLWPASLSQQPDSPVLLYLKGTLTPAHHHAIAIVGSRQCTHYGRSITRQFTQHLGLAGYSIISGLARGIDTEAHRASLDFGHRTIAVIGSGLHRLYPPENEDLAAQIAEQNGALISEFPLRYPPDKQTFPQRNRIVAAWSSAVLVTECRAKSGSLITASFASENGLPVFAVPGPVDRPSSAGCHDLIRNGAILATEPNHLLDELGQLPLPDSEPAPPPNLTATEHLLFEHLSSDPATIDDLASRTRLPVHEVSANLLSLEIKGAVKQYTGQKFTRS
ncbi:MAG: DNA-processing protein DprA [Verrucomicrobiota bacterium]